jgi:glucose/arabinose dehydrogenase
VLRDADGDNKPEVKETFAGDGLRQPFGIAFYPPNTPNPTHVYVANTDSVVRFPYKNGDTKAPGPAETIVGDLPGGGYNQHWTRNVIFKPDGSKMYVSVGSQGNIAEEEEKRAAILEYNPDGSGYRVFASGLRNPVGLAFNPVDGALWTAVNERDGLGDGLVPDYAARVQEGKFYGWPYTYIGTNDQPDFKDRPDLADKTVVPDVLFGAHAAALGIQFYDGNLFPANYRNSAFVALHGSWNRADRYGYKIVRIPVGPDGKATSGGYEDFVTGWKTDDGQVWGRPVDVAVDKQGGLLITDDGAGKIYRVLYGKPASANSKSKAAAPPASATATKDATATAPAATSGN